MNYYIFLCRTIYNVGGAEIYISNKILHLEKLGYKVEVFYQYKLGRLDLPIFFRWKNNCVPFLGIDPSSLLISHSNRIIDNILKNIPFGAKVIFECSTMIYGLWGEILAEKVNGTNLIYLLDEVFPPITERMKYFLSFKRNQQLLFGINDTRIPLLLGEKHLSKGCALEAVGTSNGNVADIPIDNINKIEEDTKVILSLGRFNKPYFLPVLEEVIKFIGAHPQKRFMLIFVGSCENKILKKKIHDKVNSVSNLKPIFLGYCHPIPRRVFDISDIAIASAGSVIVADMEGVTTISINCDNYLPMGFFKYTTDNFSVGEITDKSVSQMLVETLFEGHYKSTHQRKTYPIDYSQHDKLLNKVQTEYYEVQHSKSFMNNSYLQIIKNILRNSWIGKYLSFINGFIKNCLST